jgi:Ca-activated chloride channel homolog
MNFLPFGTWSLFGPVALASLALLVLFAWLGARALTRKHTRFGNPARVAMLRTAPEPARALLKQAAWALGVASLLATLARPQGGEGKRHWVQTTLDLVIVLDYSKSMYARDIAPSRIDRAKLEVGDLIHRLPGARVAAVAFAGEPMSFPLSADGNAVSQFFRQLSPVDMPVGGTATARALERARELLSRDSREHERAIVLVTDGEDLEGDPVGVAEKCASERTPIHVIQIGGSKPENIPEVDESGNVNGTRRDNRGRPLTTALSPEGEQQLRKVAEVTGGTLTRATAGKTGISELATMLQKRGKIGKREEVVTGRDEWFVYPLALAILLLLLELLLPTHRRRNAP